MKGNNVFSLAEACRQQTGNRNGTYPSIPKKMAIAVTIPLGKLGVSSMVQ